MVTNKHSNAHPAHAASRHAKASHNKNDAHDNKAIHPKHAAAPKSDIMQEHPKAAAVPEATSGIPKFSNSKPNNLLIGIVSIIAIILIVLMAIHGRSITMSTGDIKTSDVYGQASLPMQDNIGDASVQSCRLIVGQTTLYDGSTLSVLLDTYSSALYSGYSIKVTDINENGCVVDVNGDSDYIAVGQIERIGPVYVTVTGVILH